MKVINASDFKAKCLRILDDVARTGEGLTILKRGKPIAQITPIPTELGASSQAELLGTVRVKGDSLRPALPPDDWEAEGIKR